MYKKKDILFLVVLYEQDFKTSITLKSLIKIQNLLINSSVFIWDNSVLPQTNYTEINSQFPKIEKVEYYTNSNNTPLSTIYNYMLDKKVSDFNYITLLDHDTNLTENFIKELLDTTNQNNYNLILPKIYYNEKIVSPAKLYYFLGFHFNEITINKISTKYLTAINSGMTIKTSYISDHKFRYDENLKFYGTDDYFMKTFQKNCKYVYVLNSKIYHTLNYYSDEQLSKKVWRFHQLMFGIIYLNKDNFLLKFLSYSYVFIKSLKESFKYKSLKYIYYIWKNE